MGDLISYGFARDGGRPPGQRSRAGGLGKQVAGIRYWHHSIAVWPVVLACNQNQVPARLLFIVVDTADEVPICGRECGLAS